MSMNLHLPVSGTCSKLDHKQCGHSAGASERLRDETRLTGLDSMPTLPPKPLQRPSSACPICSQKVFATRLKNECIELVWEYMSRDDGDDVALGLVHPEAATANALESKLGLPQSFAQAAAASDSQALP